MRNSLRSLLSFGFCLLLLQGVQGQNSLVQFHTFPQNFQLFQRDVNSNLANVSISGSTDTSVQFIRIRIYKNNQFLSQNDYPVQVVQGQAGFDFSIDLQAELSEYRIESSAVQSSGQEVFLQTVHKVLAGDSYLIMGQSNAKAAFPYTGEHPFLRSYQSDSLWTRTFATFGIWGKTMAELIVNGQQIPVCFINTAVGSTKISEHQEGTLIFQKTINNLDSAGFLPHLRGFFWFQGEGDAGAGTTATAYANAFYALDAALEQQIGQIDKKYIIQIRNSCWENEPNANIIQEVQRSLAASLPNYGIMGTQGLEHDGCHFTGLGYISLGNNIYRLIKRDLYDGNDLPNTEAPSPDTAYFSAPDQIVLECKTPQDSLQWLGLANKEFSLTNSGFDSIVSGFTAGNKVFLQLSGAVPSSCRLSYVGHAGGENSSPVVQNMNGVGMLAFHNFPISTTQTPEEICNNGIDDDGNGLIDAEDPFCDCATNPQIICPDFNCDSLQISVKTGQIALKNTATPIFMAQIYDADWQLLEHLLFYDGATEHILPDVGEGGFHVIAKGYEADWTFICEKYFDEEVANTAAPDCSKLSFEVVEKTLKVHGLNSPIVSVLVFDKDWNTVFTYFQAHPDSIFLSPSFPVGSYYAKVSLVDANWVEICSEYGSFQISTDTMPNVPDCGDLVYQNLDTLLVIDSIANVRRSIQVWDVDWTSIFSCFSPNCSYPTATIPLNATGIVYVKVQYFDAQWQSVCVREGFVSPNTNQPFSKGTLTESTVPFTDFNIFPNPNTGIFSMFLPKNTSNSYEIQVFNAQGLSVLHRTSESDKLLYFDLTALKKGMYQVVIRSEARQVVRAVATQE